MTIQFGTAGSSGGGGGGELLPTQAIVNNGQSVIARQGQQIDITVSAGYASFSVRSYPFWEPFTLTGGVYNPDPTDPVIGYAPSPPIGSITNQPVEGYVLEQCTVEPVVGRTMFTLVVSGIDPLRDQLNGALFGINNETYGVNYSDMDVSENAGIFTTTVRIYEVPAWVEGQQVPVVVMPFR